MKKGFTLVELLAVIVILGIIIGLAIPQMISILNEKKETLYQDTKKELERLAAAYIAEHPNLLRQDNITITIDNLCEENYIECPVIDPRDNSEMNGVININKENNKYIYSYENN